MERKKLKAAREAKGQRESKRLSQQDVADAIGCSREIYSMWERGQSDPQQYYIDRLVAHYGVTDPRDLDLVPNVLILSLEEKVHMLEGHSRREILAALQGLSVFAGIDLFVLFESPQIAPDEFLEQCSASLQSCWHLMRHNGLAHVENIAGTCMTKLSSWATEESDIQGHAASLAVEAKTLQGLVAMHRMDYTSMRICSAAALRFSRMSSDRRMLPIAFHQRGIDHFPSTVKAIPLFLEGLAVSDAPLSKATLSSDLALAYGFDGKEDKALEMIQQARSAMPQDPEADPLFHLIDFGASDLDRVEGRVYLALAEKMKSRDYAEKAYNAFAQGASKQATSDRSWSQTLIHQADASFAIGNLDEYIASLEQGWSLAQQVNSLKRKTEAREILDKAPNTWKREQAYKNLVKLF